MIAAGTPFLFRHGLYTTAAAAALIIFSAAHLAAGNRGMKSAPEPGGGSGGSPAWMYLVAIDNYKNVQKLTTAVADAKAVKELMLSKYQFDPSRVIERYNEEATRENIIEDFYQLAKKVGKNESLFVYYGGHGYDDKTLNQMYWVPVDGRPGRISSFISSLDIRGYLSGIPARHIWLVSDSCFSGSLLADRAIPDAIDERYYREKYKLPSRVIMTSGGKEPVADQSGARDCAGHSVFACYFLKYLKASEQRYVTPQEIFTTVGPNVSNNSDQTPVIGALLKAGHEGGEFVLMNRLAPAPQPGLAKPVTEQAKAAEPPPEAKVAMAPPPPPPPPEPEPARLKMPKAGTCGPSPTGKGGSMCAVPEGKFGMGCNKAVDTECDGDEKPLSEVFLEGFRIDRHEVTVRDYQECVSAGACTQPDNGEWCTWGVNGKSNHPVNCVDWLQANTYCEWAGKRLPTEAEWEKAARGTDGRKFPWGNTPPACDLAVHSAAGCSSIGTKAAGSKPRGAGPYGAEDTAGNVAEWVHDCNAKEGTYDPLNPSSCRDRIIRGGAWRSRTSQSLRTSNRALMNPFFRGDITGIRCALSQ